jgi:hypothetical protein
MATQIDKKEMLDVYVCLDVDDTNIDTKIILQCLQVYITVHQQNYQLNVFEKIDVKTNESDDVIQRGMYCFNKLYEILKLKTRNNVWFIYISSGNVKMFDSDVTLLLLNKNPGIRQCFYTINKKPIKIYKTQDKNVKLSNLQVVKRSLEQLFTTTKTIKYQPLSTQF